MTVAVINISMRSPHGPDRYADLWTRAFRKKRSIKIWSDYAGLIGSAKKSERNPQFIEGDLFRYLDLDQIRDWFNTQTNEKAEKEELGAIAIPEHLKPHFVYVPYLFDTKAHKLFYVMQEGDSKFGTNQVVRFLRKLFADEALIATFGEVSVVAEPERSELERIFSMQRIRSLKIEFSNPPNAGDDLDDAEQKVMERLEGQNLKRYELSYQEASPKGIHPDRETQILAQIAQSNGKVSAKGDEGGRRSVEISTASRPMLEHIRYDPNIEVRGAVFLALIDMLRHKLRRRHQ